MTIKECDIVEVTSKNPDVPDANIGDIAAVVFLHEQGSSVQAVELECVDKNGNTIWLGTFEIYQVQRISLLTKSEAEKIVTVELDKSGNSNDAQILTERTVEKSWGWVFFYQSAKYIQSGDFRDMFGGNSPIIVNRYTHELQHTGTAHPVEKYIESYESQLPSGI